MNDPIQITVLVENTAAGAGLLAEHGWSCHIRAGSWSFLFDTGQSSLLRHNAARLGLDLSSVQGVALSHGHYDHAGGLAALWEIAPRAALFLHPAALQSHLAKDPDEPARNVGIPRPVLEAIGQRPDLVRSSPTPTEVHPGFFLTGQIPRLTDFEDVGGPFYLDEAGTRPDPIADDQALFFENRDGLVVVLGCAHAGVVNTLHYIRSLTDNRPIHTVLGGMHLLTATPHRLDQTFQTFRQLRIPRLGPAHCTGMLPAARLWTEFPGQCFTCGVGTRLLLQA